MDSPNINRQMRAIDEMFDMSQMPLVYGTKGVVIDFAKHQETLTDADLINETLETLFVYDSPLTILERTLTTTGAAQQLILPAPTVGDLNVADYTRIVCLDLAIQLNSFTLTKTDMKFNVQFLDATGQIIAPRTQVIEGNASVVNGDTRQYVRLFCLEQNSTLANSGVTSPQDGKLLSLPRFMAPDAANFVSVLAGLGVTAAVARTVFPSFATDVAAIVIDIPAGAFAAGVILTATPITVGRLNSVADVIRSLDSTKNASASSPADVGQKSLLSNFLS